MTRPTQHRNLLGLAVALCVFFTASAAHATLIVEATVTPIGGLFHYDFSVTNNAAEDVVIVSITDAPVGDPFIDPSLVAPVGFLASYDSGLGFVDFLEDTDLFGVGTTKSGFMFDSASGPTATTFSTFEALTVQGNLLTGQIRTNVIPEPGTITLLLVGMGAIVAFTVRKRKRSD